MKYALKGLWKALRTFFMWVLHLAVAPFVSGFKAISTGFADLADKLEKATAPKPPVM